LGANSSRQVILLPPPYDEYIIEGCKAIVLEEAEKLYNVLVDQLVCEVINERVIKQSSEKSITSTISCRVIITEPFNPVSFRMLDIIKLTLEFISIIIHTSFNRLRISFVVDLEISLVYLSIIYANIAPFFLICEH
jgi:hypothetical protein